MLKAFFSALYIEITVSGSVTMQDDVRIVGAAFARDILQLKRQYNYIYIYTIRLELYVYITIIVCEWARWVTDNRRSVFQVSTRVACKFIQKYRRSAEARVDFTVVLGVAVHVDGVFFGVICLRYLAEHRRDIRIVNPHVCRRGRLDHR